MKRLLSFLFLLMCLSSFGQNIAEKYGTNSANGVQTCSQRYVSYTAMKSARPLFCAFLEGKGVTQAEALRCYSFEADIQECMRTNSRATVDASTVIGVFKMTMPIEAKFQKFIFAGPAAYVGPGYITGGTSLVVDNTNWNKRVFPNRSIFLINDWGQPANVPGQYAEGFSVSDVMLEGGRNMLPYDNTFESYGIAIRSSGSACAVRNVVCNGFNNAGFAWAGGIPIFAENTRSFYNGRFGYYFAGTALSTGVLVGCESDDNGEAMFGFEAGYGQLGGGNITVYSSKAENGKNLSNNALRPMKLAYVRGSGGAIQFVGFHSALYGGIVVPTAFDIQGSNTTVTVTGFNECGSNGRYTKMLTTASKSYGMTNTTGNTCKPISWTTNCVTMTGCSLPLSGSPQPDATVQIVAVAPLCEDSIPCPPVECPPVIICPPPVVCPQPTVCPPCPVPSQLCGDWYKSGSCRFGSQTWKKQCVYLSGNVGKILTSTDSQPCSVTVHP